MSTTKNGMIQATGPRDGDDSASPADEHVDRLSSSRGSSPGTAGLQRSLADIKGQAQFLLYLADQIEDSLEQLHSEADACHSSFLCKVLGMYSGQLESKHQGLGEKIAEACQEVYVTVRERELI
jgi:hypothetical protein